MPKRLAEIFLEELDGQELWPTIHNCAPLVQVSGWTAKKYYGKFYNNPLPFPIFVSTKNGVGIMYIPLTKTKELSRESFELFLANESHLTQLIKQCAEYESTLGGLYNELTDEYFENHSEDECRASLEKLRQGTWDYNALAFFSLGFDRDIPEAVLNRKIDDELWAKMGNLPIASFERRHGWYVAEHAKDDPKKFAAMCQYFFASYDYVPLMDEMAGLVKRDYALYLQDPGKALFEKKELEKDSLKHELWIVSLPKSNAGMARYLEAVVKLRDRRKDYLLMMTTVCFRAARAAFKRLGIDQSLAGLLIFDELLKGDKYLIAHQQEFAKRRQGFDVYGNYNGDFEMEYGHADENRVIIDSTREQPSTSKIDQITGQVGYPGLVRGKVKIILNVRTDSQDFKDGQVLVAGMTRPEYVPLMKKAVAIITDEGGITCHAAIVSRELKKPCIIGTKIATKVLHDGDEVEVDADKGIVRIIKKANS